MIKKFSNKFFTTIVVFQALAAPFSAYAVDELGSAPEDMPSDAQEGKARESTNEGQGSSDKDPVEESCGHRMAESSDSKKDRALDEAKKLAFAVLTEAQTSIAKAGICYINQLVADNRVDQEIIYGFVRQIRNSLEGIERLGGGTKANEEILKQLHEINKLLDGMMKRSYEDWLFQNGNLSNQIQKRLPGLVTDAATLISRMPGSPVGDKSEDAANKKDSGPAVLGNGTKSKTYDTSDVGLPTKLVSPELAAKRLRYFQEDLRLLSERYSSSLRILAGIGVGYNYLPRVKYSGRTSVDVSDVLPEAPSGSDRVFYESRFADRGFPSLNFTAKMRAALVEFSLRNLEESQTIETAVFTRPFNDTEDLMGRSTIKTKLTSNYDVNLRFSVFETLNAISSWWFTRQKNLDDMELWKEPFKITSRDDLEVGMGLTGFGVEDTVSTDFRRRTDSGLTYSELPSFSVKQSKEKNNFNGVYFVVGYRIALTDQFSVGVTSRRYINAVQRFDRVKIDDYGLAITASYYPLF